MRTLENHRTNGSQGMTVLLVEDDEALLELFLTILRRDGYEVLVSINGREELDLANSQFDRQIDILLIDVSMPYMRGIELAKALRQTRPDIQVLSTSGMPQQDVLNRAGGLTRAESA